MPNLIERLERLPVAGVSDVQRNLQAVYAMDPAIHSLVPGAHLAGPAFTVGARSGSIITVHKALLEAPAGCVLVVGGETAQSANGALFGKLMATQAQLLGIKGIVVDGPVRDVADLCAMGFPVFARGTSPHVGNNRMVGQTQVAVSVGGLVVNPGDYIHGDADGVAVIPAALVEQVVAAVEEKLDKEAELVARMQAGEHLSAMIGFRDLIYGQK
jgi:regulator of RNase E activity RraA